MLIRLITLLATDKTRNKGLPSNCVILYFAVFLFLDETVVTEFSCFSHLLVKIDEELGSTFFTTTGAQSWKLEKMGYFGFNDTFY